MSKSQSTSLTLRLPATLRARIQKAAEADRRNESQFVRVQLEKILEGKLPKKSERPS